MCVCWHLLTSQKLQLNHCELGHCGFRYPKGSEERLRVYQAATGMLGSACYVEGAMSSMLFLALEFHDDFMGGVLANANCGGMN